MIYTRDFWDEHFGEVMDLRNSGWTLEQIGKKYKINHGVIRDLFIRKGIPTSRSSNPKTIERRDKIIKLRKTGLSLAQIGLRVDLTRENVWAILKKLGLDDLARGARVERPRFEKPCPICGTLFGKDRPYSETKDKKTCSRKCGGLLISKTKKGVKVGIFTKTKTKIKKTKSMILKKESKAAICRAIDLRPNSNRVYYYINAARAELASQHTAGG